MSLKLIYSLYLIGGLFAVMSFTSQAEVIITCKALDGSITYVNTHCPAGYKQLSKKNYEVKTIIKSITIKDSSNDPQDKPDISAETPHKDLEKSTKFTDDGKSPKLASYVFLAKFAQVLSSVSLVKTEIAQYYLYRGRWPGHLSDLGYEPADKKSSVIDSTSISGQGRIRIDLGDGFGNNKQLWFYPTLIMGGHQIEWSCYANFLQSQLTQVTGDSICESRDF